MTFKENQSTDASSRFNLHRNASMFLLVRNFRIWMSRPSLALQLGGPKALVGPEKSFQQIYLCFWHYMQKHIGQQMKLKSSQNREVENWSFSR